MTNLRRIGLPAVVGTTLITLLAGCSGSAETPRDAQASTSPTVSSVVSPASASASPPAEGTPTVSPTPVSPTPTSTRVETPAAGFNAADVSFAQRMIPHHLQAIDMASLAGTRAGDQWVGDLAGKIQEVQDPEIRMFKSWLDDWGKQPMPRGHKMPGMLSDGDIARLAKAKGAAFDRLFVTMMIEHHRGAIKMAEEELTKGAFADARTMAESIATTQRAEIKDMKKYLAKLK